MTTASKITLVRVALIPVFMVFLLLSGGENAAEWLHWAAIAVFAIASITDFVDGQVARRCNQVTDFGKFIDTLADKLLVTSCFIIFVGQGRLRDWAVFIIIARELAISGLRMIAANNGRVIAAAWSGKIKTACTMLGLLAMLAFPGIPTLDLVVEIVILVTTIYSGIEYFCKNWSVLGLNK